MEKLLHAYVITGPEALTVQRAREMAAGALCESAGKKPCGSCRHCRKVMGDIHPDVSFVRRQPDTSGKLRKELVVGQIRALGAEAPVLPNEAAGKVYIFPDADTMNQQAQNAFLKLLEEPPSFVRFFLCTQHPQQLLETVRSRCALLRLEGEVQGDTEAETRAESYLRVLDDGAELLRCCIALEKLDTQQALSFVEAARDLAPRFVSDPAALLDLEDFLAQAAAYLRINGGVKHVMGYLSTYTNPTK